METYFRGHSAGLLQIIGWGFEKIYVAEQRNGMSELGGFVGGF